MTDVTAAKGVFQQYREVLDAIKQLEERRDALKELLISALAGESEGVIDDRVAYTYRTTVSRRIDTKALQASMPDIAERFRKESVSVSLRLVEEESVEQ